MTDTSKPTDNTPKPYATSRPGMPNWAGLRIWVVARRVMEPLYNELEQRFGLMRDESALITCLAITTAETAQEVARYTGRPKNSISRAVNALEKRQLLGREPHPSDRRASALSLTPEGLAMFDSIKNDYAAADERLLATLDTEERKQFIKLVAKITEATADWS